MSKKLFGKVFIFLLVVGLLFAALPTGQAQAQTPTTLNVAQWSATASVGVVGRPTVLLDGVNYHLWYGPNDATLYHTVSTDPAAFPAGALVTFSGGTPVEVASTAIFKEGATFYMVAYGPTNQTFDLYSSPDGAAWTFINQVFNAVGMSDLYKIDAPFVFKDGGTYKLYFQKKKASTMSYDLFLATSATVNGTYALANGGLPVLSPTAAAWDGVDVMHPWVVKDGTTYYMWYSGFGGAGNPQRIGFATSSDGITWTKSPANPIIGPVGEPSVIKNDDTWQMWYLGDGSAVQYISAAGPFEFQTIQAAVTAAVDGDVINVAAGTYNEQVNIDKALTLVGPNAGIDPNTGTRVAEAIITGSPVGVTVQPGVGVVTLNGFTVQGYTDWGFKQTYSTTAKTRVHVLYNIFSPGANSYWYGVQVVSDNSTVLNNLIMAGSGSNRYSIGVMAWDSSNLQIKDNLIGGATSVISGIGISDQTDGVTGVTISRNTINNTEDGIMLFGTEWEEPAGSDIWLHDGSISDVTIDHNIINTALEAIQAYALDSLSNLKVEYNQFVNVDTTNGTDVDINTTDTVTGVDLSPNWWDKATGPVPGTTWTDNYDIYINAGPIAGSIYVPWCGDADCTILITPPVHNVTQDTYYTTIQGAINATTTVAGDIIQVAPGTYTGQININKPVSIIGSGKEGPNATIITSNALGTVLLGATGTVDSPILLKDLQVTGAWGVRTSITPIDYFTMDNVWLNANPVKSGEGFRLVTGHQLSHLTINNSIIEGYIDGVIIEKTPGTGDAGTKLQYVSVTNTIFRNNYRKGLYVETLSDAVFTNVQLINNGYVNPGTNLAEYNSAGFDLNLKDGTYSNLQFINMTATGNGLYAKDGAALMIKARSDGATYGLYPATLTNVTITGGSFTGNERGIRFGEPGKSNAGPTNVVINGATILNNVKTYAGNDGSAYGDLVNLSLAPVNATKNWWGSAAGPVAGQIVGNVAYCAWLDSAPPAGVPVAYPVTNTTTLEGFCTIQAAIDDAETLGGHTITVAAGTYVENVVVDKSVEISGAGQANTFVIPAISNPAGGDGSLYPGASNVFLVQASDVKIHDLTVDGDNPALTSTYNVGGANLDARNGIITDHTLGLTFSNLQVYNTTVKNIYLRGIYASTTGGTFNFHHNTVTNVQAEYASIAIFAYYGPGVISNNTVSYANDAISANHSRGIQFLNNTVTHSGSGIHTDNSNSSGGVADLIQGNSVDCTDSPNAYGIWTFVPYVAPTVNNNTVTNCAIGLSAWGQGAAVTTQFTNNTVTGDLSAGSVGVYVTTDLISWGYTDVSVNFTGNTITGHETAMAFVAGEQAAWNPGPFVPKTINAVFHQNKIFGNTYEVSKDEGGLAYNADVTLNWWGSACGPTSIPAGIPYSPWYTNDAFTSTATGTTGSYTFPTGSTAASINSVIACAAPDSTLTFDGLYPGGIIVPADRTDLTFKLSNDTVITGTTEAGYCINVFGDHIRIETENFEYGLPKCIPAGDSSGIYVNWTPLAFGMPADNEVLDLIIDGLEIDGTDMTQSGITLSSAITDVQIINNYIHHCSRALTADHDIQGRFDIQGNMFKDNTSNIVDLASSTQGIVASYNSWGVYLDPTQAVVGDATYTPWTHMELFIEHVAGSSPWVNQLVSNNTMEITYAVKADMKEITGAEFLLKIPAGLTVKSATAADVFDTQSAWAVPGGVQYYGAQFDPTAAGSAPVTGQAITLFTVTLTASAPGTYDLTIDETTDAFSMLPPMEPAPSTWVYLDEAHKATVLAIELPTIATTLTANYEAGVVKEFTVTITNPTTGGVFTDPVLVFAGLPTGTTLEYYNGSAWGTFTDVITPDLLNNGLPVVLQFRVTFTAPAGAYPITITLNDSLTTPDQFLAQTSGTATVTLLTTPVVGTLSMQGRAFRGDIPMTLTPTTLTGFAACTEESINHISNNITFVGCLVGDTYVITTNQARYLDVTVYLNKTINLLTPDYFITALELKAGDADDSNKIDVSDAGIVGGAYGIGTDVRGDVNFDGKFNIQDLALVGGNYGYDTSEDGTDATNPYLTWVP